ARFAKPVDEDLVARLAADCGAVVTAEEGTVRGGFGDAVLEVLSARGLAGVRTAVLGIPDEFIEQGNPTVQRQQMRLDAAGIALTVREVLERPAVLEPAVRLRKV